MTAFWVYEDFDENYARVHRSECPSCNDGTGVHGVDAPATVQWLGFATYPEARAGAAATGRAVSDCQRCAPA